MKPFANQENLSPDALTQSEFTANLNGMPNDSPDGLGGILATPNRTGKLAGSSAAPEIPEQGTISNAVLKSMDGTTYLKRGPTTPLTPSLNEDGNRRRKFRIPMKSLLRNSMYYENYDQISDQSVTETTDDVSECLSNYSEFDCSVNFGKPQTAIPGPVSAVKSASPRDLQHNIHYLELIAETQLANEEAAQLRELVHFMELEREFGLV